MKSIATSRAPAAIGPYAQAVEAGGLVFCSGQIALAPGGTALLGSTAAEQAGQALRNLAAVLEAAGLSFRDVASTTVYLADMADLAAVNAVYAVAFGDHKPARAAIQAAALPRGALVEISCIAVRSGA